MKKGILILLSFLVCTVLLTGCSCQHEWTEASCTEAKTCTNCGETEGGALGHLWQDASCTTPKTCSRCALTEGAALGHDWEEATCTIPKTCSVCAVTEGQPLEHIWEGEATLFAAPVCSVCGTVGDPLPGYLAQNCLTPNTLFGVPADYISNTYVRPDLDTTGSFLASDLWVFESDSSHWPRSGYEWRCVNISITFSDKHSYLYGTNVTYARADYYQDQALKQANKQEYFNVTYKGKEYPCRISYENAGFYFIDNSNVFQMTCYAQVPVGYDGVVLAFYHSGIDINGMHLHEVEDENMLLLRLA